MRFFIVILLFSPKILLSQKIETIQEVDQSFLYNEENINGHIDTLSWHSIYLDEKRSITVYIPPNYDNNIEYGVLCVTDGAGSGIADDIEYLIQMKMIKPIIIVGLNLREAQPIDSILTKWDIDFRSLDYLKVDFKDPKNQAIINDAKFCDYLGDRHSKYSRYLANEVIPYVKTNYSTSNNQQDWTLGGYSNGGAFVYAFSTDNPNHFGNAIVMSPAWVNDYDIWRSKCIYFLCAGKDEPGSFISNSLEYLNYMKLKNIPFIHKTYNAGHDWEMWFSFYLDCTKTIYKL